MPIIRNNILIKIRHLTSLTLHRNLPLILHNKINLIILILLFFINLLYLPFRVRVRFTVAFLLA